jgi:hypothetical protein
VASSPERPPPPEAQDVRWPLIAKLGLALAVITVLAAVVAAILAAFVVDRDDEPASVVEERVVQVLPVGV